MGKRAEEFRRQSKKRFDRNLKAFAIYNRHLVDRLKTHDPEKQIYLGPSNTLDITDGENLLFGGDAEQFATKKLTELKDNLIHLATSPPEPGFFDRFTNPFVAGITRKARENGWGFSNGLPVAEPFYLFIFGAGLGHHLDRIIDLKKPRVVFIFEPDLDTLYLSLFTYDWAGLFERFWQNGGAVYVSGNEDIPIIIASVQQALHENCPAGLDGSPCLILNNAEYAQIVLQNILQVGPLLLTGVGFLYDETVMMRATYNNMAGKSRQIFCRDDTAHLSTPVFVIGAGPSLDNDLDFIRANQHRAILISTGTAIRSLLLNGIRPDFQVELENVHVYSSIKALADETDLSGICLVGPSSIEPHIVDFFDEVIFYFRSKSTPLPLFADPEKNALRVQGALVVDVSFALALDMGAKNIFLLGTDFGTRGVGKDHAKDNVTFTEDALLAGMREYDEAVTANFGGEFFASFDFLLAIKSFREVIQLRCKNRKIVNCSDGAYLDGALPMRSQDITLSVDPSSKHHDIADFKARSATVSPEMFASRWDADALRAENTAFANELTDILGNPEALMDSTYLSRFMVLSRGEPVARGHEVQTPEFRRRATIAMFYRGTIDTILMCVRYYLGRVQPAFQQQQFAEVIAAASCDQIAAMHDMVENVFEDPTEVLPAREGGKWEKEDFIVEEAYTWGETPRNAICPCGSGKRFKHCHGAAA
jgi:hypothetical protein